MQLMSINENYLINSFEIIPSKNVVIVDGISRSITPKMMAVLNLLSRAEGEAVTKQDILDAVWADVSVSELVLSRAITDLRKVFNETAKNATVIKTIPKVGYCLNAKIVVAKSGTPVITRNYWKIIGVTVALITMLTSLVTLVNYNVQSSSVLQVMPKNLTADLIIESQPRYSSSGNLIAYVEKESSTNSVLKIYSVIKSEFSSLWTEKGNVFSPVFSPDEKSIAFRHVSKNGDCKIFLMDLNTKKTDSVACLMSFLPNLDWSPSGKWLVTGVVNTESRTEGLALINVNNFAIKILTEPKTEQTAFLYARFSPDSTKIVFSEFQRILNRWELKVIDIETGELQTLKAVNNPINQVVWSDNNDIIYYVIAKGQDEGLWQYNIHSSKSILLYSGEIKDLDYSSEHNQFIITKERKELHIWSQKISEINAPASPQKVSYGTKTEYQPEVNRQNNRLAFISNKTNSYNLWVKDLVTGEEEQWTTFEEGSIADIKWSSDGKTIFFNYFINDRTFVYSIKYPRQEKSVFNPSGNYRFLNISEDDNIYYVSDSSGKELTYSKNISSGKTNILFDFSVAQIYTNNNNFYYKKITHSELFKASYEEGKLVSKKVKGADGWFDKWRLIKNNFYSIEIVEQGNYQFIRYNLDTQKRETLFTTLLSNTAGNLTFSVSADEKNIYYTQLENSITDILFLDMIL